MITHLISPFPSEKVKVLWDWTIGEKHKHFDDYGPQNYEEFVIELNKRIATEYTWGVYSGDELIGYVGAVNQSPVLASLHGVVIDPNFRGKGAGTKAVKAVVEFLKTERILKVVASFFSDNAGIENTFRKIGGVQEGLFTGVTLRQGTLTDIKVWSLT